MAISLGSLGWKAQLVTKSGCGKARRHSPGTASTVHSRAVVSALAVSSRRQRDQARSRMSALWPARVMRGLGDSSGGRGDAPGWLEEEGEEAEGEELEGPARLGAEAARASRGAGAGKDGWGLRVEWILVCEKGAVGWHGSKQRACQRVVLHNA